MIIFSTGIKKCIEMGVFQMTAAGLDIRNVNKIYQSKSGNVFALDQINLQVKPKEFVSLL